MSVAIEYPFMNNKCLTCEHCNPSTLYCDVYRQKCMRVKTCGGEPDAGVSDEDIEASKTHPVFTAEDLPYMSNGTVVHEYKELYGKMTEKDFLTKWDLK